MKRYLIEIIVIVIISASYGFAAYQRNLIWKDDLSIWSDVVEKSPEKFRGHNNLGNAYAGTRPQSTHNGVKNARNECLLSLSWIKKRGTETIAAPLRIVKLKTQINSYLKNL